MKTKTAIQMILIVTLSGAGLCKAQDLQWQQGKIIQIVEERNLELRGKYNKGVTYTVQGNDYTYVATETAGFVTSKFAPRRADESDSVKFALKGGHLTILGKDGKEYSMWLRTSAKRQP